jgi:hypothetical protein
VVLGARSRRRTLIACACALVGAGGVAAGATAEEPDSADPGQAPAAMASQVFVFTNHPETYTVPAGVRFIDVQAAGGHGGSGHHAGKGGPGIAVEGRYLEVNPGEQLRIVVGGDGGSAAGGGKLPNEGQGGYNGGGDGARGGGGGGGFSYIQRADGTHIVVAAGGGGAGSDAAGGPQNPPGTLDGQNGGGSLGTPQGGGGGTLTAGGRGGHNASPLVGDGKGGGRWGGGNGGVGLLPKGSMGGAGGGGGYFGGGGGAGSEGGSGGGGGAGSSYVIPNVLTTSTPHAGSGQVTITPLPSGGAATSLALQTATTMDAGSGYGVVVTALDAAGVRVADYRGTVHFSSSIPGELPADYTFVAADRGQHEFRAGARFRKAGTLSVTVTDVGARSISGTAAGIQVKPGPLSELAITPKRMIVDRPQVFRVEGSDAFGNDLGDVSAQTEMRLIPEAGCTRTPAGLPVCTAHFAETTADPWHVATATLGRLVGRQKITVLHKAPAKVTLRADPDRVTRSQSATFTATVRSDVPDVAAPSGDVTFYDGDTKLGSAALTRAGDGSSASWKGVLRAGGERKIAAVYDGDSATGAGRAELTYRVLPQNTTPNVFSTANPSPKGTVPGFRVYVRTDDPAGSEVVSRGTVVVMADGNPRQRYTVTAGESEAVAHFPTPLEPGDHTITADYLGTDDYRGSHGTLTQVVVGDGTATSLDVAASDASPEAAEPISFSATVTAPGEAKPAGSVSFLVDGAPFGAPAPVVNGKATSTSTLVVGGPGPHTVVARYLPSAGWAPSSASLPGGIRVQPTATRTTLTSSAQPSDPGDAVSFTAQVTTRWDTPEGRVRFSIDGREIAEPYNVIGGRAVIQIGPSFYGSLLGPGPHVIGAEFQPYNNRTQASSARLGQQVGPATPTTTTLRSSDDRSDFGQPITFAATIATSDPSDDPTGTVQFAIDGAAFGSPVDVVDGKARSVPTAGLAVGDHRVTATYSGGRFDFGPSSDTLERQTVVAARTSTSLSSSANPWDRNGGGGAPQYTIRVTSRGGTPTGTVTFSLDTYQETYPLVDGRATVVLPPLVIYSTLDVGLHPVRAEFHSDGSSYVDSGDGLDQLVKR